MADELISREVAEGELNKIVKEYIEDGTFQNYFAAGVVCDVKNNVIAKIPSVDAESLCPKWISVEDRLPDESGCYLIHQKANSWFGEVIQTAHWNMTAQKFRGAQAGCVMKFVTHWMPLPEPPKGECA